MQARQTNYSGIVGGGRTLSVPPYQRNYRWDRSDLLILWTDILAQYKELLSFEELDDVHRKKLYTTVGNHYMGTVVLAKHNDSETEYDIIDGQQRLTTLSLLLAAIREAWYPVVKRGKKPKDAAPDLATLQLRSTYNTSNLANPSDDEAGKSSPRIRPHLHDRLAFDEVIAFSGDKKLDAKELGLQQTLVFNTFKFFFTEVRRQAGSAERDPQLLPFADCYPLRFKLLRDVVTTRLRFVEVTTDTVDDANAIFESLNGKGRHLDPIDLLKNYIYMTLQDDYRTSEVFWDPIIQTLGSQDQLARLIWADMVSRGRGLSQRKLYTAKKQEIATLKAEADGSDEEVWSELTRLRSEAVAFLEVSDPINHKHPSAVVSQAFADIKAAGGATAVPLLMYILRAALSANLPETEVVQTIRLVESYLMRRFICGLDSHNLNSYFSAMLVKAHEKENLSAWSSLSLYDKTARVLNSAKEENWPNDEELAKTISRGDVYTRGETAQRLLMFKRLDKAFGQKYAIAYTESNLTIEHILPQNPDKAGWWQESLEQLGESFFEVQNESLNSLANLIPLLGSENSSLQNGALPLKMKVYGDSKLEITRSVADTLGTQPTWGRHQLAKWATELLPRVVQSWPKPALQAAQPTPPPPDIDDLPDAEDLVAVEDDDFFDNAPPTTAS